MFLQLYTADNNCMLLDVNYCLQLFVVCSNMTLPVAGFSYLQPAAMFHLLVSQCFTCKLADSSPEN